MPDSALPSSIYAAASKSEFCNRAEITEVQTFQRNNDLTSFPAITTEDTSPGIDDIGRVGDVFPVLIVLQGFSDLDEEKTYSYILFQNHQKITFHKLVIS